MIKHIVMWKVKTASEGGPETPAEVLAEFRNKTEHLKTIIPEIISARVASNLHQGGFDICIDSVFESMETLDTYIFHPEHLKVRAYMDSVTCDKAVFDYEFQGEEI